MLDTFLHSGVDLRQAVVAIGFSLAASVLVYVMYQLFYGASHIGAGVHRSFIIGGPAITTLFLGIQTSIPLSLGLLGALSFVRFRTPVKDPAEIGYLLLLIATSIGAATANYLVTAVLLIVVLIALSAQSLIQRPLTLSGWGNLMISADQPSFLAVEDQLTAFLNKRVPNLKPVSTSVLDNRVSVHYRFRRRGLFDQAAFLRDIEEVVQPTRVEVFVG